MNLLEIWQENLSQIYILGCFSIQFRTHVDTTNCRRLATDGMTSLDEALLAIHTDLITLSNTLFTLATNYMMSDRHYLYRFTLNHHLLTPSGQSVWKLILEWTMRLQHKGSLY